MKNIDFSDVNITGGFWKKRQEVNREVTAHAVYERFRETHRFAALACTWKEGEPDMPHIFWDSDVAKWIEGAAYILKDGENQALTDIIEDAVDKILKNSDENGYFNSHFLVTRQNEHFTHRGQHELYCAGHLMEAAVAYYNMTGRDRFLKAMCRYADYIEKVFKIEKSAAFTTPGHPELELALMRLYRATGEKRYAELSKYFIDEHGKHENDREDDGLFNEYYNQDEMPLRDRKTAEGHCVRALYLLCGMADVAKEYGDGELLAACRRCFDNITGKRMYITGGVGSTCVGEAFTLDYDLPNRTAYAETCAAIALALFSGRMLEFGAEGRYADVLERALYNGILSGVSMDGRSFFYENPLEVDPAFNDRNTSTVQKEHFPITQRVEVFDCSCCPPNILRFLASVGNFLYGVDEDTLYIHQYMDSEAVLEDGTLAVRTAYPADGKILISCRTAKARLAVRIPGWCESFRLNRPYELKNGYAYVTLTGEDEIEVDLEMPVRLVRANRRVHEDAGRVAVMRGPVVYCAEGVDNGPDIRSIAVAGDGQFALLDSEFLLPALRTVGYRPKETEELYVKDSDDYEEIPLTLIPYYAFANRGTTEMALWLLKK